MNRKYIWPILFILSSLPGLLHAADFQSIKIQGATTLQSVITTMGGDFGRMHKVSISVEGGGTGQGIKCAKDTNKETGCDIGMISRGLEAPEKEGLEATQLGWDSLAFVVNGENTVKAITDEQAKNILTGKITNWKELGGKDKPIHVLTRGKDAALTKLVSDKLGIDLSVGDEVPVNEAVLNRVTSDPAAFSFVSLGWVVTVGKDKNVKPLIYNGVEPTLKNLLSNTYTFRRPLMLIVSKENAKNPLVKEFIDFAFKNRQHYLPDYGYTPTK